MANHDDDNDELARRAEAAPFGTEPQSQVVGREVEYTCPTCGEPLLVYVATHDPDAKVEIMRRRDMPSEDEDEDGSNAESSTGLEPDE